MTQLVLKQNLKSLLATKGVTASHLARAVGVPKQTISGWLGGQMPKDLSQVKRVAQYFDVTVDELCFENSPSENRDRPNLENLNEWHVGTFEIKFRRTK